MSKRLNVALIGNPNTGKSSVFNDLTGLNQKVGNYPGITVEKKEGLCKLERGLKAHILDLPGTYSLNASSLDESVVIELLLNKNDKDHPNVAIVVSDVENLKRNLLLFTQIKDLNIPAILVINMSDVMRRKGISIDISVLEKTLDTKVILYSSRDKKGLSDLKEIITSYKKLQAKSLINITDIDKEYFTSLEKTFPDQLVYKLWLVITQDVNFGNLDREKVEDSSAFQTKSISYLKRLQQKETIKRYQFINNILKQSYVLNPKSATDFGSKLDRISNFSDWPRLFSLSKLMLPATLTIVCSPVAASTLLGTWDCQISTAVQTEITYETDQTFHSTFNGDGYRKGHQVISEGRVSGRWAMTDQELTETTDKVELTEFVVDGESQLPSAQSEAFEDDLLGQVNVSKIVRLKASRLVLKDSRNRVICKRLKP